MVLTVRAVQGGEEITINCDMVVMAVGPKKNTLLTKSKVPIHKNGLHNTGRFEWEEFSYLQYCQDML